MTSNEFPKAPLDDDAAALAARLFDLARNGDGATLGAYIDQGINVDLMNHDGNTFLMLAAYAGNTSALEALIARGADVNRLNDRGQSPLAGAIFKKEDAVVDMLLAAGADPTAGTPSAIDTARLFGQHDLVQRLEAAGGR